MKKKKLSSVIFTLLLIVVLIGINIGASALVNKYPSMQVDFTVGKNFELSSKMEEYLDTVETDVKFTVLMTEEAFENNGAYYMQINTLLKKMALYNGHITVDYVDLNNTPTFSEKYDRINWDDTTEYLMLVESGENYQILDMDDVFESGIDYSTLSKYITASKFEQAAATAIFNVTTTEKPKVVFLKDVGEGDYSGLSTLLQNNAFEVEEINLTTTEIPEDADFVVLFAPSVDLTDAAKDRLYTYLDDGRQDGANFIYMPSYEDVDCPNIDSILEHYSLSIGSGIVFETDSSYLISSESLYLTLVDYNGKIFMDGLTNDNVPVIFPYARPVEIIEESESVQGMLYSSTSAGIYPFDAGDDFNYEDVLTEEEIPVAVISSLENSNTVVFGSCDAFAEALLNNGSYNNGPYFVNVFNTLAEKSSPDIVIESKSFSAYGLGLTSYSQVEVLSFILRFVAPALILVAGIVVFTRRRNK